MHFQVLLQLRYVRSKNIGKPTSYSFATHWPLTLLTRNEMSSTCSPTVYCSVVTMLSFSQTNFRSRHSRQVVGMRHSEFEHSWWRQHGAQVNERDVWFHSMWDGSEWKLWLAPVLPECFSVMHRLGFIIHCSDKLLTLRLVPFATMVHTWMLVQLPVETGMERGILS